MPTLSHNNHAEAEDYPAQNEGYVYEMSDFVKSEHPAHRNDVTI